MWKSSCVLVLSFSVVSVLGFGPEPDNRTSVYEERKAEALEAAKAKAQAAYEKTVARWKRLSKPIATNDTITVTITRLGRRRSCTGKLTRVGNHSCRVGTHTIPYSDLNEDDKFRLDYADRPQRLAQRIALQMKAAERQRTEAEKSSLISAMEVLGYGKSYFADRVRFAGRFRKRRQFGDGSQVLVRLYGRNSEHMQPLLELTVNNKSTSPSAAVLVTSVGKKNEMPLMSVGELVNGVKEQVWKSRHAVLLRRDLTDREIKNMCRSIGLHVFRPGVGSWTLRGVRPMGPKKTSVREIPCPECWRSGKGMKMPPIDVATRVERMLAMVSDDVREKVKIVVQRHKEQVGKAAGVCATCKGAGVVPSRCKVTTYAIKLALDEKSLTPAGQDSQKAFAKLIQAVPVNVGVAKHKREKAKEIWAARKKTCEDEVIEEVWGVVKEGQSGLAKRMHQVLEERFEWKTKEQIAALKKRSTPGIGNVVLLNGEDFGHVPTKALGKRVRRYTRWKRYRKFRSTAGEGFDLLGFHYRFLELGGQPIAEEEKAAAKPKHALVFQEDVPRRKEKDTPQDILERDYAIQLALRFYAPRSRATKLTIQAKISDAAKADEDGPGFPLVPKAMKLQIADSYPTRGSWMGDLIATRQLSFAQLVARTFEFEVDVK